MQARQRLALRVLHEFKEQHAHAAVAAERVERAREARRGRTRLHRLQRSGSGAHSGVVQQAENAKRDVRRGGADEDVRKCSVARQQPSVHSCDCRLNWRRRATKAHEMRDWRQRGALRALQRLTLLLSRVVGALLRRRCTAARHQHAALRHGIATTAVLLPEQPTTFPAQNSPSAAHNGRGKDAEVEARLAVSPRQRQCELTRTRRSALRRSSAARCQGTPPARVRAPLCAVPWARAAARIRPSRAWHCAAAHGRHGGAPRGAHGLGGGPTRRAGQRREP